MSDLQFQWVMPIGSLSESMTLEETNKLILSGRVFPPQLVSINGQAPTPALNHPSLQNLWREVTPPDSNFDGVSGRVNILSLSKLLARFALERTHGRLFVHHSESSLYFHLRFVSGQLLEVSALDSSTYLGQLLIQRQQITPSELVKVIDYGKEHKLPVGRAAIKLGLIDEKTLNLTLSEQMFVRIRKIACFSHVNVRLIEDQNVALIPPVARISGYSLLEIVLGYGLSDPYIKTYMGELLNRPIKINRRSPALKMISAEDRSVLKQVDATQSLEPLKERRDWTQRDSALKAIVWDIISLFEVPLTHTLTQEYAKLSGSESLSYLGLNQLSPPHVVESKIKIYQEQIKLHDLSQSADEEHIKRAIKAKLKEITRSLDGSERERRAYQRLQQMGADPSNPQLFKSALFEICIQEGEAALKRQRYNIAAEAYKEALTLQPNDLNASLNATWASFLESSRDAEVFELSKKKLEQLGLQFQDSPKPPLYLARLYRLFGDPKSAEQHLRRVLELDPNHQDAQAELRLLFNREFDQKRRKVKALTQINPEASTWITALGSALAISLIFGLLGNFITHPREIWPEERNLDISTLSGLQPFKRQLTFNSIMRTNYSNDSLASTAYRLGLKPHPRAEAQRVTGQERPIGYRIGRLAEETNREISRILKFLYANFDQQQERVLMTLRSSLVIPSHLRVIGNIEHYWLQEDLFGWSRRLALILIGLFGIIRLKPLELKTDPSPQYELISSSIWLYCRLSQPCF